MSTSLHAGSGETSPTRLAEIEARTRSLNGWAFTAVEDIDYLLSALRAASDREAALRAELMRANDRANLWSMFASSAAIALEPLGEAYEFDDPDSLSGAITRLIQRVSALSSDEQTNEL